MMTLKTVKVEYLTLTVSTNSKLLLEVEVEGIHEDESEGKHFNMTIFA